MIPDSRATAQRDNHFLAIGAIEDRMLILIGIEKLMSSAETGLIDQTLQ